MDTVAQFVIEVNTTNSSLEKQKILGKYKSNKTLTKVLEYVLDPIKQFNVSSKNVIKYQKNKKYETQKFKKYKHTTKDMFKLLDDLSNRVITGNEALKTVNEYLKELETEHQQLFYCILDKNLKTRMNAATVNKVYETNIIVR